MPARTGIKKPQPRVIGVTTQRWHLPLERFRPSESRAGVLACGLVLLSAPSQGGPPQWSLQISFRSQLRGSAGFTPASLITGVPCAPLTFISLG